MGLFANYDIEDIISSDNVSTRYRCVQSTGKMSLSVEILSQQLVDIHSEIVQQFKQGAFRQLRMNHFNIARIVDSGISTGLPYIVSEFYDGTTLDKIIADSKYSLDKKLGIIVQICKAMIYAHRNGIVHLRLTPNNILVTRDMRVVMRDFGFAQFIENVTRDKNAIRAKLMLRSMAYTPPEMQTDQPLTAAADIYSLGVIMYELVTGGRPVDMTQSPVDVNPSCPVYLGQLILQCLEKEPSSRPSSVFDILMQLLTGMQDAHIDREKRQSAMVGIDEEFVLLDILKESKQSIVYLFRNTVNNRLMAVKKIFNPKKDLLQCKALSGLRNKNIVDIYGAIAINHDFILKTEYMDKGSLRDRMVAIWPWREALKVVKEICTGLSFVHKTGTVHGNLRPSNVFFSNTGTVKIADFCLDEHYHGTTAGTNWYRLPKEENTAQVDIFSVGAMLFEMVVGRIYDWQKTEWTIDRQYLSLPAAVQKLITRMLEIVPKDRYKSCDEIINLIDGQLTLASPVATKTPVRAVKQPAPKSTMSTTLITLIFLLLAALMGWYILSR